ncbi:hypothetical protein KJ980_06130 [Patescibacteria group bacterium]|nr:hypothetical protein [Patescibacteria group bacterium]MBU4099198.1 hypothetical protein [Patescibacteria group bacterium]
MHWESIRDRPLFAFDGIASSLTILILLAMTDIFTEKQIYLLIVNVIRLFSDCDEFHIIPTSYEKR